MEKIAYKKAVIYCRVSSEKQVREGGGLESQEHRCRSYARSLGLAVEKVFKDEGISGGLFDRPAIKMLLQYLDENWQEKYCVIFDDLKRFARDVEVHIKLRSELRAREAQLRCLNYNFDDSAEGEFVETIFAAQNELERKQNRRQVCQKMKARVERGYWCFYPPTAYEYIKDKEHGKILAPIQPVAGILAEGLTSFAENRLLTQTDFLNFLKSKGFFTLIGKDPKRIRLEFAKRLLTEQIYAGIIELKGWDISRRKGHHKAIITEGTFDKIQAKLFKPERPPRETDNIEFPLRRLVVCSICGKKMTGSVSKGKNKYYPHYTCNNKECSASPKNINPVKMEGDFIDLLNQINVKGEVLELAKDMAISHWGEKVKGLSSAHEAKEAERKEIEQTIEGCIDLLLKTRSESVKARYEAKIEESDKKLKELENRLETKKAPDITEALNLLFRLVGTPAETWIKAGSEAKNSLYNMIFTEPLKYSLATGFGTPKLSLPFNINEHFHDPDCLNGGADGI